jgi:hypothetical protein
MSRFKEQSESTRFCFKLGDIAMEVYEMLKLAFGDETVGTTGFPTSEVGLQGVLDIQP